MKCLFGLMPDLIKKSWTDSKKAAWKNKVNENSARTYSAHTYMVHRSLNKLPYMLNRQFGTYVEFAKNSNVKELCCFAKYNMPSVVDFYRSNFFVCRLMCLGRNETRL